MSYDIGDRIRLTASFTTMAGAPVDPATLVCRIKTPGSTITSYTYGTDAALVQDSTGVYHIDVDVSSSGTWYWRFAGTGNGQAAEEGSFDVERSQF